MTELHRFIWEHREDDPGKLALSAKKYPTLPIAYIARQVEALGKVRRKIPSWYQMGLDFPVPISLEQASSEATGRFKAALFSGNTMADLTGGQGVDASFFAQQFGQVFFVEKNPEILAAARHNLGVLGLQNIVFSNDDAAQFLAAQNRSFDLLYLDPARRDDRKGKVFQLADCSPNVLEIKDLLLKSASRVLIKTAPLLDIHQAIHQLKNVSKVWVLEHDGDCREVLYLLEKESPEPDKIPIFAVSINKSGEAEHTFQFNFLEEQQAESTFSAPAGFLYEPVPAVLKAGAFKTFAKQFGISKLHPNTHLYTSDQFVPNLPARAFQINAVCKYDKKAVEKAIPAGKANISTRNFPDSSEQVRKKLGLRDGGDIYVFAATNWEEKKLLLVCSKV
jgi:16S rRNA G966 N2-methylase RsmD